MTEKSFLNIHGGGLTLLKTLCRFAMCWAHSGRQCSSLQNCIKSTEIECIDTKKQSIINGVRDLESGLVAFGDLLQGEILMD